MCNTALNPYTRLNTLDIFHPDNREATVTFTVLRAYHTMQEDTERNQPHKVQKNSTFDIQLVSEWNTAKSLTTVIANASKMAVYTRLQFTTHLKIEKIVNNKATL